MRFCVCVYVYALNKLNQFQNIGNKKKLNPVAWSWVRGCDEENELHIILLVDFFAYSRYVFSSLLILNRAVSSTHTHITSVRLPVLDLVFPFNFEFAV